MNQHTPAQIKAIQTWTEQRDALLREIGVLSVDVGEKEKLSNAAGLALTDINNQIAEARGRIAEYRALEERYKTSVSINISELEACKSRLEAECTAKEIELHEKTKAVSLVADMTTILTTANDTMKDQSAIVDQVVGQVIKSSQDALSELKGIMNEIKNIAIEVIEKSEKNISQTNIVIGKLPKFVFDMQRPIPVRRTYPVGHPKHKNITK